MVWGWVRVLCGGTWCTCGDGAATGCGTCGGSPGMVVDVVVVVVVVAAGTPGVVVLVVGGTWCTCGGGGGPLAVDVEWSTTGGGRGVDGAMGVDDECGCTGHLWC